MPASYALNNAFFAESKTLLYSLPPVSIPSCFLNLDSTFSLPLALSTFFLARAAGDKSSVSRASIAVSVSAAT